MTGEDTVRLWKNFIDAPGGKAVLSANEQFLTSSFFSAIQEGEEEVVTLLIQSNLVSPNTALRGETPLLKAVATRNVRMVETLLGLGADRNAFGNVVQREPRKRTPLQLAASKGQLVLVKLLIEKYHCDESLVAPDGQIALRLASQNGHREIVDYLPARRGGGFRRWKHSNRHALQRGKKACKNIYKFLKFFIWDIEKFFLWTTPKHLVVKPLSKAGRWCWDHRGEFGPWCKGQALKMPGRIKAFVKWLATVPRGTWEVIVEIGKFLWRIATDVLPRMLKAASVWTWKMLTVKIPKALAILAKWFWKGVTSTTKVIWNAVLRMASWIATTVEAIISFFRSLTLEDIWNGFVDVLYAVFVALPKVFGSWIAAFGDASYKMMTALFGCVGLCIWYLGVGIAWVVMFLPKQAWVILKSFGEVMFKAGHEIRVWLNPKAT
ncbi:hypothetical protein BDZ45DRAFT_607504 [Acephala macrosclerotiorum]|nr:hypothetical protein BDZ45DRAFT_607504 [Acephala macrosclerotiorum]